MSDGSEGAGAVVRRGFYVLLALLITAVALAGFWPTYWGPLFSGTLDLHWLLHLHGVVFTSWLILLIAQATLVYRGRTDLHQKLGTYVGVGWGVLVFTVGLSVAFGTISPAVGREFNDLQGFLASFVITLPSMLAFGVLFGAALIYRKRPAVHKRLMIVATLALLSAATARLGRYLLGLSGGMSTVVGRGLPIGLAGLAMVYDRWIRGRVHPAYWIAVGVLVLDDASAFLRPTDTWVDLTSHVARVLKSVLLPLM